MAFRCQLITHYSTRRKCSQPLANENEKKLHEEEHKRCRELVKGEECGKVYSRRYDLKRHYEDEHDPQRIRCPCGTANCRRTKARVRHDNLHPHLRRLGIDPSTIEWNSIPVVNEELPQSAALSSGPRDVGSIVDTDSNTEAGRPWSQSSVDLSPIERSNTSVSSYGHTLYDRPYSEVGYPGSRHDNGVMRQTKSSYGGQAYNEARISDIAQGRSFLTVDPRLIHQKSTSSTSHKSTVPRDNIPEHLLQQPDYLATMGPVDSNNEPELDLPAHGSSVSQTPEYPSFFVEDFTDIDTAVEFKPPFVDQNSNDAEGVGINRRWGLAGPGLSDTPQSQATYSSSQPEGGFPNESPAQGDISDLDAYMKMLESMMNQNKPIPQVQRFLENSLSCEQRDILVQGMQLTISHERQYSQGG